MRDCVAEAAAAVSQVRGGDRAAGEWRAGDQRCAAASCSQYQENQSALLSIQTEKAAGAATRIEQFLQVIEQQMAGAVETGPPGSVVPIEQRRSDYLRLLRQAPAITEISYLSTQGLEELRISRLAMNVVGSGDDHSEDPRFLDDDRCHRDHVPARPRCFGSLP